MATLHLKRFSRPETLKKVDRRLLLQFLAPYREFFRGRGVELPPPSGSAKVEFDRLSAVLMSPDVDTPDELANALYFVHEMATTEGMDQLLAGVDAKDLLGDRAHSATPAEVAIAMWLKDRERLEQKHAESALSKPRAFEYFQAERGPTLLDEPTAKVLAPLEQDLDGWFERRLRGRGCRVFPSTRGEEIWFLVRHGDPFKREASLKDGEPSSVFYRPEKIDVVVYTPALGELRIYARSKGEKSLYRKKFGFYLFGDEDFFPGVGKYTLEPLRKRGPKALVCEDVEGLDWVILRELRWVWPGAHFEIETRRATDLFAAIEARGGEIPEAPRLQSAKFQVKFTKAKRPRTVAIRPSNIADYTRDPDSVVIEEWLTRRGFSRAVNAET